MPGRIFISYRLDDLADAAARLADGLVAKFGRGSVFMDVDSLLPGQRFDRKLAEALSLCDVLVAVIGPRWMELLAAREARWAETGEHDYVRVEIAEALRRGVVVIPVLVGRYGQMPRLPRPNDLPEDIRDLVLHQKHDVAHERFSRDVADLAQAIVEVRRAVRPPDPALPWRWPVAGASAVAALAVLYLLLVSGPGMQTEGGASKVAVAPERSQPEPTPKFVEPLPPPKSTHSPKRGVVPLSSEEEQALGQDNKHRGYSFRECAVCPEMVVVPSGSYTMGSPSSEAERQTDEGPQRDVKFARPFAVGKFEVTFDEWDACVADHLRCGRPDDGGWGRGKRPVINVSWDQIVRQYLPWLNEKVGKPGAYRLLTEAEWEYAARAGTTTRYHFGDNESDLCTYANVADVTAQKFSQGTFANCRDGHINTAPVGSFRPNDFMLHDMHGNVWEWVQDCYGSYKDAPLDGSARETARCTSLVTRGGSWFTPPKYLRSAIRLRYTSVFQYFDNGFRVGRTF